MSGAMPNQAKKQLKKASHERWKARICGVSKRNSSMREAFCDGVSMAAPEEGLDARSRWLRCERTSRVRVNGRLRFAA
jgi:hypothetical protein